MKKRLILGFLLAPFFLFSQITTDQREIWDAYVEGLIKAGDPGGAIGIVMDGQIVYEKYFGNASLEHQVPVSDSTVFNIASVAKQFTALCVLQLSLETKLSLESDFRQYLPGYFPGIKDTIRIRHLLNHTSGIRDVYDLLSLKRDHWWRKEGFDNADALDIVLQQRDLNFIPGSEYLYSNSNYMLLTALVEKVSGMSFHSYSKQLFEKLDMRQTHFQKNYMRVVPNRALPYSDWGDGVWKQWPMITNLYGDGFLYTTLHDQLVFEQKVQEASEGWLAASQQPIPNAEIKSYGFGLELTERNGERFVFHKGSTGSYHAYVCRYPERSISIVAMGNNGNLWSEYVVDKLVDDLGIQQKSIQDNSPISFRKYRRSIDQKNLAGVYQSESGKIRRIKVEENQVFWQQDNNQPIALIREEGGLYHANYNENVKIGFTSGSLTLFLPGSKPVEYSQLPPFIADDNYLNGLVGTYRNGELDLSVEVRFDEQKTLRFFVEDSKFTPELEVIHRDRLLASDYILHPERDSVDYIQALLLTYSRLKSVRLDKVKSSQSRLVKFTPDSGSIQLGVTSENYGNGKGDLLLTKNNAQGNEEWFRVFGGQSYELAGSVELTNDGGYLVVGSTSSIGNGNYDAWVIKLDGTGNEVWSRTFGTEDNEYGVGIKRTNEGYVLRTLRGDLDGDEEIILFNEEG